ncbi:MAG TPA: hypothetical protein VI413_01010, partial [Paludibacter sp.]
LIKKLFCFIGASAPSPDLLFVLPQKVSKKGNPSADGRFTRKTYAQLADPSTDGPNSLLRRSNRTVLNANFTCFSVHRTRSLVSKLCAIQYLLSFC